MDTRGVLSCELSELHGATIVRPTGRLDIRTYAQLHDTLLKCAVDQPRAVIVDTEALDIAGDHLTSVFVAVWMRVSQWSHVPLVVIPGQRNATLFDKTAARRFLTVQHSMTAALEHIDEPPRHRRTALWLPPSLRCICMAERFVTETCDIWGLDDFTTDAVRVTTELVSNAAIYTRSEARLRLESWPGSLTVAVADSDPRAVRLSPPAGRSAATKRGLEVVASISHVCGCSPARSGGKVVWAVLRAPSPN